MQSAKLEDIIMEGLHIESSDRLWLDPPPHPSIPLLAMLNLRNPVTILMWEDVPFWEEFNPFGIVAKLLLKHKPLVFYLLVVAKLRY